MRCPNGLLVKLLEPVFQHRPVNLLEHVQADLDLVVGPDAEDLRIERGVVQLAEREAVWNDRMPLRMPVWQNVRGLEEFLMPQMAHCAMRVVCREDALAERLLVQPLLD